MQLGDSLKYKVVRKVDSQYTDQLDSDVYSLVYNQIWHPLREQIDYQLFHLFVDILL